MMASNYRLKLFFVLLAFAIVVTFTISTIDYLRSKQQAIADNEFRVEQVTETVNYALKTIDKAYHYLVEETAEKMQKYTYELQEKYDKNTDFNTWNFQTLSEKMNMDVYIIDEGNKIIHSNVADEIGLDFSECCASFDAILKERRAAGELFIDGIDLDQQSGEVKKFSYMATPDKKYMIELGYSLEHEALFQEFNFLTIVDELAEEFSMIGELHVLNFGGLPFGTEKSGSMSPERREAFERAREKNETVQIESNHNGKDVFIRYVPYQSEYDEGDNTKIKVVEIIYDQNNLNLLLHENLKVYIVQLFIILVVTILVSSFIANWFATPVYMAFHDSLTKLKNRAAFDDYMEEVLLDRDETTALLMMDLDNFKLVNDYLGHGKGDHLLQLIAQTIKTAAGNEYETFRLGGDEFAIIMPSCTEADAVHAAERVIVSLKGALKEEREMSLLSVSVSVGIALSEAADSSASLFKKADIALYESKEKGKNQYQVYDDGAEPTIPFME